MAALVGRMGVRALRSLAGQQLLSGPSTSKAAVAVGSLRSHASLQQEASQLLRRPRGQGGPQAPLGGQSRRGIWTGVLRAATRLRYWLLAGTLGGGAVASQAYDEWRKSLPDIPAWVAQIFPDTQLEDMRRSLGGSMDLVSSSFETAKAAAALKRKSFDEWVAERRQRLIDSQAAAVLSKATRPTLAASFFSRAESSEAPGEGSTERAEAAEELGRLRSELLEMQARYQREVEELERENRDLRGRLLQRPSDKAGKVRKTRESLIDLYSQVLDSLQAYDAAYSVQDNLPRVVVVGDQSSGKTSVLEMIAQARIFPRGAGEMMTRAPVKVTLAEGPYHIATFRDSTREFDLSKEADLEQLRREIEVRMTNSVKGGKTVSSDTISLSVKGPGLPRMVLVDLPGVISTVTTEMARETKDDIVRMCSAHMQNPNAIILCIQDGSVDAERSNVVDLVSSMDPKGKRTILVLTKVDLAEQNIANPDRIGKIMAGKLFPMKALGYFAVVTGKGNTKDSIASIRKYEEDFFAKSRLARDGVLSPGQMTTGNMSTAVSATFWGMVRDSVEAQADAFRAARYNLETEWKNSFPRQRQCDREELFERARGEILDEIVTLSQLSADEWQARLRAGLWERSAAHVFDNVYLPAAARPSAGQFHTAVDIALRHWADKELPSKAVQVGWDTLQEQFRQHLVAPQDPKRKRRGGLDCDEELFKELKAAVLERALQSHQWDSKALDYLRLMQHSVVEEREVPDKKAWEAAARFMEEAVTTHLAKTRSKLSEARGPSSWERWRHWRAGPSEEQRAKRVVQQELGRLLASQPEHGPSLSPEELTVVRGNVVGGDAGLVAAPSDDVVRSSWHLVYREHFLRRALGTARECRGLFFHYKQGLTESESEVECGAVPLFWRVSRLVNDTSAALRHQITNTEARRLEKETKDVLDEWQLDRNVKKTYLKGRRVELAEELNQVRLIQERLEEFVTAMKTQKS